MLYILLLTSSPFSLNSRHELRRAHTSSIEFLNLALQQNGSDVESYVSFIILHVMAGEDAYASNFYKHREVQEPVPVMTQGE